MIYEWFTKINPDAEIIFFNDKTIAIHEILIPYRLKCIQTCLSLGSTCQFFQYKNKVLCTIFNAIEKDSFYGNSNLYLREKKLPRIYFKNGSFLDQNQLLNISTNIRIDIYQSGLSLIGSFAFEKCKEIQTLNISYNNLTKIYSKSFYGMTKMIQLFMNSNQISELESDVFQDIPLLNYLSLNSNLIKNLDGNLFDYSKELVFLNLGFNQIECLNQGIFKNLKKLKRIIINNNKLKSLEPNFDNLESLEQLDLSANKIFNIHSDTFNSLTKINRIDINNNLIPEINSETFKGALNLITLKILVNNIQKIHRNFSTNVPNLEDLDISFNNLSTIEPDIFNGLIKLKYLGLYSCGLKIIDFSSLVNLKSLTLTLNKIEFFSQNLSLLLSLQLNGNPLTNLTLPLITSQNSILDFLDISQCNLKYIDLNILRNFTNLKSLRIGTNPIKLDNQTFIGFQSLKQVDVDSPDVERFKNLYPNINFY
ncbi:unnamed protein product [Brachionus calyciflorus]|uniref:Uncharacterized protein n=1 Tax=Brachionus calyciflorus TaxID=104777 RepID=A0A814F736_9BILA|nr:unnamed protein product [Brachionus calyciflorus]